MLRSAAHLSRATALRLFYSAPHLRNGAHRFYVNAPRSLVATSHCNANPAILRAASRAFSTEAAEQQPSADQLAQEEPTTTATEGAPAAESAPQPTEVVTGQRIQHEFQAETQKLLHIVAQSLYTEREVFVREIVSNASDAMEKVRHLQLTGNEVEDKNLDLEINIYTDNGNTLTIQDAGIGMNKEELVENLGRIGHSGSMEFLKKLGESKDKSSIIGQFGVGFYSTFMVGNKVKVFTRSATPGSKGYLWESDGTGSYSIAEADGVSRGTKIIIELKENSTEFANKKNIENIIKKYSNFVGFPIKVNGERVNTIRALWTLPKANVTDEEHKEFYQFVSRAYDTPMFRLHYATDSPINIRGLFYFPAQHMEKYGMGRMEPGVNLFSRKVLIQAKAKGILPEWLRFVKGVVDSEDIPLNLSREHLQDSSLIQKLNSVLTKRILKFLDEEAKKDPEQYTKWFNEFGSFIKEGICTDYKWKEELGKLLRYESSTIESGKVTSLDEYVSRMPEDQREIYYLCVPGRSYAESSPYYEGFKARNMEVLFLYTALDDFVMSNMSEFNGKKLMSIESARVDSEVELPQEAPDALSQQQVDELCAWMRDTLSKRLTIVRETKRLQNSPAIIVDHESASYRRMMKFVDPSRMPELPKQQLEINAKHPIIKKLYHQRVNHPVLAKEVAEQMLDNALVAAGLVDDSRGMLPRLNKILEAVLDVPHDISVTPAAEAASTSTFTEAPEEQSTTTTASTTA